MEDDCPPSKRRHVSNVQVVLNDVEQDGCPPSKRRHISHFSDSNAKQDPNSDTVMEEDKFRKKLLVLDVNGLLVDIVAHPDEGYQPDAVIGSKAVFKRPFCDDFLKFCFQRFDVGVWTSRTRRNIEQVLKFLQINSQDRLLFCWDQFHCTKTGFNTIENSGKPLVLKELKKLWEKQDSWAKGVYNESNTILLDDSPYKALRNPPHTAIFPYSYSYRDTQDNGLGPNGDLRNYLEKLAACDDVQKFIEHNPFGQQPITYDDESWYFYRKIIGSIEPKADPTRSRRKLIILDTGGLLVDIASTPREGFKADTMQGSTSVFKRPYCDEFLQFCFKRFNVGVWTSTSRYTTEWTLDYVMGDSQHKLVFCWDRSHCTDTGFSTVENTSKALILKQLKKLWEKKDADLPWDIGEYDETNTLLIDNTPHKALLNSPHTSIFPHRYRYFNSEDNSLGPKGDLRVYLERLAESENVQKFVSENPFGQRPIREKNLSWRYYQKVIHAISSRLNRAKNISEPKLGPTAVSDAPALLEPKVVSTKCLEPETGAVMADAQTSLEPETDTTTDLTDQASLKSETNNTTVLTCQMSLEPETTVLAAPNCLEVESDTSVLAAQTLLEPETETATVSIGQTSLEQETDTIMADAQKTSLEPETDTATGLTGQISLEPETDHTTGLTCQTTLEPETDNNTVLAAPNCLEVESNTSVLAAQTSLEPETAATSTVLIGQTSLEPETDTIMAVAQKTSLEQETDTIMADAQTTSLEPETKNTAVLAAPNCLEAETDTSILVVQTSLEPEIDTIMTGAQTSLEQATDTTMTGAQASLEQETDTTALAAQSSLEPETDTTTDWTGQTSLEPETDRATVLTCQISLEPETEHTTVLTGQTSLEPETDHTTVLTGQTSLEPETDTTVLKAQTSLEPETDTTSVLTGQTSLEPETETTTALTGQTSLEPETDTGQNC